MIGFLFGKVLFSDGHDIIVLTNSGVGYQAYYSQLVAEGSTIGLFASQVIREASQEIFCFKNLRDKKAFELLLTVNGVGPKSAYSLVKTLGCENIINAVMMENKNILKEAPGVGLKSASQIILDLKEKIKNLKMYTNQVPNKNELKNLDDMEMPKLDESQSIATLSIHQETIISDAIMACKELGFKENQILPLAQKIMNENVIQKPEQLIHLVLKQIG
jgi:Holliday junction DNA helicase RuvA